MHTDVVDDFGKRRCTLTPSPAPTSAGAGIPIQSVQTSFPLKRGIASGAMRPRNDMKARIITAMP